MKFLYKKITIFLQSIDIVIDLPNISQKRNPIMHTMNMNAKWQVQKRDIKLDKSNEKKILSTVRYQGREIKGCNINTTSALSSAN